MALPTYLTSTFALVRERDGRLASAFCCSSWPASATASDAFLRDLGAEDAGIPTEYIGLLLGCYAGGELLATPFVGGIADRVGRRPVLLISTAGVGAGFLLLYLTRGALGDGRFADRHRHVRERAPPDRGDRDR